MSASITTNNGLSALNLSALPPKKRMVMQIIMRNRRMTHDEIKTSVAALDDDTRIDPIELEEILASLVSDNHLKRSSAQDPVYRANLRHHKTRTGRNALWDALDLEDSPATTEARPEKPRTNPRAHTSAWDQLDSDSPAPEPAAGQELQSSEVPEKPTRLRKNPLAALDALINDSAADSPTSTPTATDTQDPAQNQEHEEQQEPAAPPSQTPEKRPEKRKESSSLWDVLDF